ncbi:polymorphic toxin type 28 domain-containing protein [Streptomyces indiaensis]|uniref:RHS repeat-associated protein n=1 Tax=Streptomyces indiaensis TaxID=284033 RepID=A0ABP5QJ57_9ACTN|nr:polymorphic toxin type 28 domain-containing protein [Streptomyces indiaensis]MCF1648142.1 polymorphic toxin type 28 domain-containing protein [Streptomyces indiaensis]
MVDLNPLHYINKFNHMMGDSVAQGLEFLGISDPAVDPDGIREIAKKWRHLATGLDDAAVAAEKALRGVEWEGKAAKAFHKRSNAARKQATEMADALRDGAKALDDFADKAHDLLAEIGVILVEIAEFEIAGLALSVLTGGTSAVVSSLMAGQRAAKVVALIARIEKEGTTLASAIRGVMEVIRAVERALKTLKEVRGVASVAKMAKEGAKFTAFDTLLRDPAAFKDPDKLAGLLTEGALMGVGFGVLGKALGKGLKTLKPADLAKLGKGLKLNCAAFERLKLNPGFKKLPASIQNTIKKFVRDPIDVATGDMVLPRVDVQLPGGLPLILERTHVSSYRFGGWFGPTWASTLDQRVQADEEGLVYAAADGSRLCFPLPDPDTHEPVGPDTPGSRLMLAWDDEVDGAIRITDPDTCLTHVFHSPVPAADDTAVDLPLQHIQDRNGNRVTLVYPDGGDIPTAVIHSGGYHLALEHHPSLSRITGLRLLDRDDLQAPGTTLLTFGYDEVGHLREEINSSGLSMRYSYDPEGRITSWTDRNDTTYWYTYDDDGRVVATGGTADALASTLEYDDATRTTRVTDSLGHTRTYEHNECLRLICETDPLGQVIVQQWNDQQQLVATHDQLGNITEFRRDERGNVIGAFRPNGYETTATYNALNLLDTVTDSDGSVWRQEYDERGNRRTITDPSGATTRFVHDRRGRLKAVTDAAGHTTSIRSDAAGLPLEIRDPLGNTTVYERDAFGRTIAISDPLGATTRLEWTIEGQLARRTMPDGSTESWEYDGEGNCTSHTSPTRAVTRYAYGHFDLLTARTDPDGTRYEYTHDSELRLCRVTNPVGRTWHYEYDPAGRLVSETDFDGRTLSYSHDAAGRLVSKTNALAQTIRFERDAMGQVTRKDSDGQVTTYHYTSSGQITQAISPDAALTRRFDRAGNLIAESVNGRTTTYTYDELKRRTSRTTPTGTVSTRTYDAADNPIELAFAGHVVGTEYDGAGRERRRRVGELTMASTYDVSGRLTCQSTMRRNGETVQQRVYSYRSDGYLLHMEDQLNGSRHFTLDAAGRVTDVEAAGWDERYAYDEVGNQTSAAWPATHPGHEATGPRTYDGNRISRAGRVHYEHDAQGRITLRRKTRLSRKPDTWRYAWNAEDRLTSVVTPDGTVWRYVYDPLGRRIAKQRLAADSSTVVEQVDFTWDAGTLCEQTSTTVESPQHVTLTWDHDGLQPLAQNERVTLAEVSQEEVDSRFFAIVTDLVGAPTELLDQDGTIAWRARSTLWGKTAWATNSSAYTPLRFPGQYYDPETDLHYNYFRYYDPESARYLSPDPLGLLPAPNPNAYVHNPQTWSDPLGLAPEKCRELGLRGDAQKAIAKLENIKKDPVGSINSQPNHNHYDAARREANGEVVARKPDGTPFDHISDLKQARNGLESVRKILEKELQNPPETVTERGLEVLKRKRKETIQELDRLNGFLHSIGHR